MREGWTYKKLGEVATYINGFPFKPSDWGLNGKPIIRIQNLTNPQNNYNRCTRTDIPEKYFVKRGDVLISWSATLGIFEWNLEDALLNQHIFKVVFDKIDIDKQYFKYAVNISISEMAKHTNGATMKHIRKGDFDNIKIPFPPLSEQKVIVSRLDSSFAKIDALKANAKKQLDDAKALFQKALEKAMEPKEGWEEKTLGDVGTFIRGGNFSKKDFVEEGFPCIHYGQIHTKFGVATYKHLSCVPKSMVKPERCALKGDLVIAITSEDNEGSCKCTAWMAEYEAYVGGHTSIYKHSLNPIFISYYFRAPRFQKAKLDYTHGFKVVEINPKDIAKIPICVPPLSEQQAIVSHLDQLSENVKRLQEIQEKTIKECDALKQAILREVFE